jgi:Ca-activated chloride channel family protein
MGVDRFSGPGLPLLVLLSWAWPVLAAPAPQPVGGAGPWPSAEGQGALHGRLDDREGAPLPGVNVVLEDDGGFVTAGSTRSDGRFAIENVPAGRYRVSLARKGLDLPSAPVEDVPVEPGRITELELSVGNGRWSVARLELRDDDRGQPRVVEEFRPADRVAEPPEPTEETYDFVPANGFTRTAEQPRALFSASVDDAFYTLIRRMIDHGVRPPAGAVRVEELLAHFRWSDPAPASGEDFALSGERGPCPWNPEHELLRVHVRARETLPEALPPLRLVLTVDVSGSMDGAHRLPLVRASMRQIVSRLRPQDEVAIVAFREWATEHLEWTSGAERERLLRSIAALKPDGATAGAAGLRLAFALASDGLREADRAGAATRIVVFSDGDFNVGPQSDGAVRHLIDSLRDRRVALSVLGFGAGNYRDSKLALLARHGNGTYAYVDRAEAAERLLYEGWLGSLVTVGQDVRLSVDFEPEDVAAWRLIGYEHRLLTPPEYRRRATDAGEVGAGQGVTALFELVPVEGAVRPKGESFAARLRVRYRRPGESRTRTMALDPAAFSYSTDWSKTSVDFRFATAVAAFGELLRDSPHAGERLDAGSVARWALEALGPDTYGQRAAFVRLVEAYGEADAADRLREPTWSRPVNGTAPPGARR